MLQIRCKNINITKSFTEGTSLLDVYQEFADELKMPYPVVAALVNNTAQGLKFRLFQNRDVEFLDAREGPGHRAYVRSLCFVLYKATQDLFPGSKLFIEHTISRGYYCNFKKRNNEALTDTDIENIKVRMQEIINLDMPFRRNEATTEEAVRVFAERGFSDKVKLLETSGQIYSDYYMLGDTADFFYGPLVPSASYLTVWGLESYHDGMLLRVPDWNDPSRLAEKVDMPKTYEMFADREGGYAEDLRDVCRKNPMGHHHATFKRRRREQGHPERLRLGTHSGQRSPAGEENRADSRRN